MPFVRTVIGAGLVAASVANADTVTLQPVKDNTMYETDTSTDLSNGQGVHLYCAVTNFSSRRRALVAFDLSSVPAGATVTGATLTLFLDRISTGSEEVSLHRVLADWGEGASDAGDPGGLGATSQPGDASWNYRFYNTLSWTNPGGDFVTGGSAVATVSLPNASYTWGQAGELNADVQGWLAQAGTNFGWLLMGDETQVGDGVRFSSREGAAPPVLTVTFTPPSACGSADFNCDGDIGTDADIEAFFACLAGDCPSPPCDSTADFNGDGDIGTDADIEAFFRVLAGGTC